LPRTKLALRQVSPLPVDLLITASGDNELLAVNPFKRTFRMPYAMKLTEVRINVKGASSVNTIIVDITHDGTSIFSTQISIDAGEKTSLTATTPHVLTLTDLTDDIEMVIDIVQVGTFDPGNGLKVLLKGVRTN